MKDIKFRGKRRDTGEWVYGAYLYHGWMYVVGKDWERKISVIPETVGQYIGLEDKNGIEIYNGDICEFFKQKKKYAINNKGNIGWNEYGCRYCLCLLEPKGIDEYSGDEVLDLCKEDNGLEDEIGSNILEIIGNIYDNPGLLS